MKALPNPLRLPNTMLITKITRTYSRSINIPSLIKPDPMKARPEDSWVKFESTYEAILDHHDDSVKVSADLMNLCMTDVGSEIKKLQDHFNAPKVV